MKREIRLKKVKIIIISCVFEFKNYDISIKISEIESEAQLSPEEEKAKHLAQVKEDNKEIAGFESRIKELKEKIDQCQDEITRCEDSMNDQDSEQVFTILL